MPHTIPALTQSAFELIDLVYTGATGDDPAARLVAAADWELDEVGLTFWDLVSWAHDETGCFYPALEHNERAAQNVAEAIEHATARVAARLP